MWNGTVHLTLQWLGKAGGTGVNALRFVWLALIHIQTAAAVQSLLFY